MVVILVLKIIIKRLNKPMNINFDSKIVVITLTALLWSCMLAHAQRNVSYKNQQWIQYYNTTKLNKNLIFKGDAGYRVSHNFSKASQYIARVGISYKLAQYHMQFTAGFAHLGFYREGSLNSIELRPYIGLIINDKYSKFKLQHRFRVEHRSFQTLGSTDSRSNMRYRYRFLINIPLSTILNQDQTSKLSFNLANEIFINGGKEIVENTHNIFNQNRLLLGPVFEFNRNLSVALTYTAEFGTTSTPGNFRYSNILWLGIKHKMGNGRNRKK